MIKHVFLIAGAAMMCVATTGGAQSDKQGVLYRSPGGTTLRLLLDDILRDPPERRSVNFSR